MPSYAHGTRPHVGIAPRGASQGGASQYEAMGTIGTSHLPCSMRTCVTVHWLRWLCAVSVVGYCMHANRRGSAPSTHFPFGSTRAQRTEGGARGVLPRSVALKFRRQRLNAEPSKCVPCMHSHSALLGSGMEFGFRRVDLHSLSICAMSSSQQHGSTDATPQQATHLGCVPAPFSHIVSATPLTLECTRFLLFDSFRYLCAVGTRCVCPPMAVS
jgi:hypothetical protein